MEKPRSKPTAGTRRPPVEILVVEEKISAAKLRAWAEERWKKDKITKLAPGFTLKFHGRAATVYYRENERMTEFDGEMAGGPDTDLCLWVPAQAMWIDLSTLATEPVRAEDRERVLKELEMWLADQRIRCSPVILGFTTFP